jgi:HK97 family phage prohead protease
MTKRKRPRDPLRFDVHEPRDPDGKWTDGHTGLAKELAKIAGHVADSVEFNNGDGAMEWSDRNSHGDYTFNVGVGDQEMELSLTSDEFGKLAAAASSTAHRRHGGSVVTPGDHQSVFGASTGAALGEGAYFENDSKYFDWSSHENGVYTLEVGDGPDVIQGDMTDAEFDTWAGQLAQTFLRDHHGAEADSPARGQAVGGATTRERRAAKRDSKLADELYITRAMPPAPEVRDATDAPADVLGVLEGHFSMFNEWYPIRSWWEGDFLERVSPGSFVKTMSERRNNIVVAFDHGFDPQIGDKVLGPINDLREDRKGARYGVDLLDTSYNRDLLPGLKRGLYGSSFRFQVVKDEWNNEPDKSDYNPDGLPERTIQEVRLFEFGPVTYPANPSATAGMRSIVGTTDEFYERLRSRDPKTVAALEARAVQLRTSRARPAPEAAQNEPIEPRKHSVGPTPRERREALYPYLRGV